DGGAGDSGALSQDGNGFAGGQGGQGGVGGNAG
ncbi:hypothetical protein, partial [Mycobacterium tuberculosis]